MTAEVIGRDAELALIEAFLDGPTEGPRALIIEGQAGMGKSTAWNVGVALARERGFTVMSSRPTEAEQGLGHVVLGDLFSEVPEATIATLPPARRGALEAALLLGEASDDVLDPRALGVALLSVLPRLVGTGRIVIAIDDEQWADDASLDALGFAIRRLTDQRILALLARRSDAGGPDGFHRPGLAAAFDPANVERIRLTPLSLGATRRLLQTRLNVAVPRPSLLRLHEATGGNPLFALELARAHPLEVLGDPGAPLRVPPDLERLIASRIARLDPDVHEALLLVAAHGRPGRRLLEELDQRDPIEWAASEGLVTWEHDTLAFSHPLLSSVLYRSMTPASRRAAHRRLAACVDDPVHRARHIALAVDGPDATAALELEKAAQTARHRGLPVVAAELAELAERSTPPEDPGAAADRTVLAALAYREAGDGQRARRIALDVLAGPSGSPSARVRATQVLAELEPLAEAVRLLERVLPDLSASPRLEAEVHAELAGIGRFIRGSHWAAGHVGTALSLATGLGDAELRARILPTAALVAFERADPASIDLAREGYRLALQIGDPEVVRQARLAMAHLLTWMRQPAEATAWIERELRALGDSNELSRLELTWYLALVDVTAGRWDTAVEHADDAAAVSREYGIEGPGDSFPQMLVAVYRGQDDRLRELLVEVERVLENRNALGLNLVLGLADLWGGRPAGALERLERHEQEGEARGMGDPGHVQGRPERVEALLQLDRIDEAERAIEPWESEAARLGRDWIVAEATRCHGLVAAARGDLGLAAQLLERAVEDHSAAGDPFGRARALLALGGVRRRQRQKRLARQALETALGVFEELDAPRWVVLVRTELGRLGGRQRIVELSPSERRVAELAADGRTNREIAATLFLGERTVATHLTHAYAKLGVRSRTELVRALDAPSSTDGGEVSASKNQTS